MSAKAATLAKNNEHARTVAQEQSQLSQSKLSEMTNTVTGRLAKADAARTTLVEKKAAASGEHVEHAKATLVPVLMDSSRASFRPSGSLSFLILSFAKIAKKNENK